ncbi:MAG: FtsX-like permease family protein [Faecousia sp.]
MRLGGEGMVIGAKDAAKLFGIAIIACCAVFVCTLFLNYQLDIVTVKNAVATETAMALYTAQVSMGKVTCAVTGGCLGVTAVVMLLFYVKNYIDTHGANLGLLKALGYANGALAKHFWVFGLSVFVGCAVGYGAAFAYLPRFYELQNAEGYFPAVSVRFHPLLACLLVLVPAAFYSLTAVLYAARSLKRPVLDLLKERPQERTRRHGKERPDAPFLGELRKNVLRSKKSVVFFVGFSAFCFSAMTQMSFSMKKLASNTFAWMIISIGLILAFTTLLLSLSAVVRANAKTVAMLRVFGYSQRECRHAVLDGYRPVSYIGFALGTLYQYLLLKLMVTIVFAEVGTIPEYSFDFTVFGISLAAFLVSYEVILFCYAAQIKKTPLKSVMQEN